MTTRLQHALEVSDCAATLYLSGALTAADAFPLRGICRDIPVRIRTLRLDLHGVESLDAGAMETVRAVVRFWRHSRGGCFRLSISSVHLVATITDDDAPGRTPTNALARPDETTNRAALMGMYL